MTYVVTENCINCKYQDCVAVCPVECFHEGPNLLVINPDECIDCGVCVPECPAKAIYNATELPPEATLYMALNAELAKQWPLITVKGKPPGDAEEWDGRPNKLVLLKR